MAFTNRVVSGRPGKVLLVGHSYGGVLITEAGTNSKVAGLVYVAAFAPDSGESVAKLLANPAPGASAPPILPSQDGFLLLDPERCAEAFAADVPAADAAFMAASQVPWGVAALSGEVSVPAWKVKPSWYIVSSDDRMIPPPAQMFAKDVAPNLPPGVHPKRSVHELHDLLTPDVTRPAAGSDKPN